MRKVLFIGLAFFVAQMAVAQSELEARYQRSCNICHLSGAGGAPISHDVAAWQPRLAKGMDVLVASVKSGMNAMPPTGMCFDCSDDQFKELIEFMAEPRP